MNGERLPVAVHVVHSLEGGGTERTLVALLCAFDHSRIRHVVVTLREAGCLASRLPDQVSCVPLAVSGRSRLAGLALARVVRRTRASVVHARNICCWPDALVCGVFAPGGRIVLGFHGMESGGAFTARARFVARMAGKMGARFTSVSESGRKLMAGQLGLPVDAITHLPNGIDLAPYENSDRHQGGAIRTMLGFTDRDWVIGAVGSLTPVKGIDVLIEAVSRLAATDEDVRLLIVGEGPLKTVLAEEARNLGIFDRVQFAGQREDVVTILKAMDVYVCSSRSEGMSNSLLEAMATGLPVVATTVGDNCVMIRDQVDGLLAPPNDSDALADALRLVRASPDLAARLGKAAQERIRAYDFRKTVSAYESYYGEPIDGPAAAIRSRNVPELAPV